MSSDNINLATTMIIEAAKRLATVNEYYFSKKLREISQLNEEGANVINLGIGNPDLAPPPEVISNLKDHLNDIGIHKYSGYQGRSEYRQAICDHYKAYFDIDDLKTDAILPLMGSKEGIMHMSMAFLNEGDEVLVPNPGYPAYSACARLAGAKVIEYDLTEDHHWKPQIEQLRNNLSERTKMMWMNYPNMPTGAKLDKAIFSDIISLAKEHRFLICHDNPYSFILNDNPFSPLSIKGSEEVLVELYSLSKSFNVAGWRLGALVGRPDYLKTCLQYKSNMDSGMFAALQLAAVAALGLDRDWYALINSTYAERRKVVWQILDHLGCTYDKEASGLFVWAKIPEKSPSGEVLSDNILHTSGVFITPGFIFGSNGKRYVRISLCSSTAEMSEALKRISNHK